MCSDNIQCGPTQTLGIREVSAEIVTSQLFWQELKDVRYDRETNGSKSKGQHGRGMSGGTERSEPLD